jgi:hypothetical protein
MDAICEFLKITGLFFTVWCCFGDRNSFSRIRSIIHQIFRQDYPSERGPTDLPVRILIFGDLPSLHATSLCTYRFLHYKL